ncbi:hypothetical protein SAMN05216499_1175 [Actinacidiphila paucisporea]|uniref:Uncharacterized protein n=1 Tax=Actinacidiphila paucisporea TaxID=310782 RepID=A0A1M7MWK4_9ACTN|nr:hypothetical protein SAMN05216499_1175 [Actinacidiphila paucisporea]
MAGALRAEPRRPLVGNLTVIGRGYDPLTP